MRKLLFTSLVILLLSMSLVITDSSSIKFLIQTQGATPKPSHTSIIQPSNVTIGPDGKIEPSTAPIIAQGNTYTLTRELSNSNLHIQRSNITFNGANYTVYGCIFIERDYVKVENTVINSGGLGILVTGSHSVISNNIFFHNLADLQLNNGYATVIGNNDTGGAYMAFYVVSDYNNLTRNSLKEMSVSGNHNTVAENTVIYLENQGKDNIYLNNIVNGTLQTIPKQTNPIQLWTAIGTALIITVVVASVSLVYFKRRKKVSTG
jgi:hypothetical protein